MTGTLKHRKLWHAGGLAFVVLVVYLSLTPHPIPQPVAWGFKFGHIAAYAWLMFFYAQLVPAGRRRLAIGIAFFLMGVALEYVQGMVGRDFSYTDMRDDAIGVIAGWLVARTPLSRAFAMVDGWWPA